MPDLDARNYQDYKFNSLLCHFLSLKHAGSSYYVVVDITQLS